MATELVEGLTFTSSAPVVVDDELVSGFADVLGSAPDIVPLPIIYRVSVELAHQAMDSGVVPRDGIVHTAESMRIRRAPRLGDRLTGLLTVTRVHHRAGATQLAVRSDILADGESTPIVESTSTFVFRPEARP